MKKGYFDKSRTALLSPGHPAYASKPNYILYKEVILYYVRKT